MTAKRKVYAMFTEYGEMPCAYSNMKKAYNFLKDNNWMDEVNYSYFSRTINKPNNNRYWTFFHRDINGVPYNYRSQVRFEPLAVI